MLELLCARYEICDSGDYWGITVHFHVEEDLDIVPMLGDLALYMKVADGKLEGFMVVYVDDNLNTGTKNRDILR